MSMFYRGEKERKKRERRKAKQGGKRGSGRRRRERMTGRRRKKGNKEFPYFREEWSKVKGRIKRTKGSKEGGAEIERER